MAEKAKDESKKSSSGENIRAQSPKVKSIMRGAEFIKSKLPLLPLTSGVYRMLDEKGNVLYVGKAKSLRKRVSAYTKPEKLPVRIQMMISLTTELITVSTKSETEAFLLENNLIKKLSPRFNILLKDDKTFPHIFITTDEEWPQITKHRGARKRKGMYFGPFASILAVNQTLKILQKVFMLRSCSDSSFKNRSRPCLLYQIKQCSAPCVGKITHREYDASVKEAIRFMQGKSQEIQEQTATLMKEYSSALEYEKAALMRDKLKALNQVQSHSALDIPPDVSLDVIGIFTDSGLSCIQIFFIRGGFNCGNHTFFYTDTEGLSESEILETFLAQFYDSHEIPKEIVVPYKLESGESIEEALKTKINFNPKTGRKHLLETAILNASEAHKRRQMEESANDKVVMELADLLELKAPPSRIEVYDNSHIQGTNAVGAMIVASPTGFVKSAYRRFNISSDKVVPGDDFGMMKEVLTRRLTQGLKEGNLPDVIIVDGGKGQLGIAEQILSELDIETVKIMGVAKGENRNAGDETLILPPNKEVKLKKSSSLLYYIQRLRDEAHRFAIGSHRAKRSRAMFVNPLDEIEKIGARRKKILLMHFGSAKAVADASLSELEKVKGISKNIAKKVYTYFHACG